MSNLTGITAHTLRYYEKNGLIHAIARAANRRRQYSAADLAWIRLLVRLRTTGMSIRQMQQIADLRRQGSATTKERRILLESHKNKLAEQITSDKVNILDPAVDRDIASRLYEAMQFSDPGTPETYISGLLERGMLPHEANRQYESEKYLSETFTASVAATHAPGMKITFGTVA